MSARDIFLLASTALVGLFCGVYVYLTVFAPVYVDDKPENFTSENFEIIGDAYGGCRSNCDSFRLTSDRSFQYLPGGSLGADAPVSGTYPRREFQELKSDILQADLRVLTKEFTASQCPSFIDGIDYRYSITLDGEVFELDTCRSQLRNNSALQTVLREIFSIVADPEAFAYSATDFQEAGVIGYLFPSLFK